MFIVFVLTKMAFPENAEGDQKPYYQPNTKVNDVGS